MLTSGVQRTKEDLDKWYAKLDLAAKNKEKDKGKSLKLLVQEATNRLPSAMLNTRVDISKAIVMHNAYEINLADFVAKNYKGTFKSEFLRIFKGLPSNYVPDPKQVTV